MVTSKEICDTIIELRNDRADYDTILRVVDANMDTIQNDIATNNVETYYYTTIIISSYAELLYRQDKYKQALPFLEKATSLWENNTQYEKIDLKNEWYLSLRLHRGICNYSLKKIAVAKEDFAWLIDQDPENERYRTWMINAESYRLNFTAENVLYFLVSFSGILTILVPKEYALGSHRYLFFSLSLVSIPILAIIQWMRKRSLLARYAK